MLSRNFAGVDYRLVWGRRAVKSLNRKRSIVLGAHRTSVSLEDAFWKSFREIARARGETLSNLLVKIDGDRQSANLSSAIRLFVLRYYRDELDQRGGIVFSLGLDPSSSIEHGAQLEFDFNRS
jgi:predicted DNA-binding ribbon-helix-helix protein